MKRSIWIVIAAVVVIVIAGVALMTKQPATKSAATTSSTLNSPTDTSKSATATITYTSSGFSPAMTTIKSGDSVTFENKTTADIQVDSNPHPVHTDDTDLNVGTIGPGQSTTVTLTKTGTFGFHNHLEPSDTANITIR